MKTKHILISLLISLYITSCVICYEGTHKSFYTAEGMNFVLERKLSIKGLYNQPEMYDYVVTFIPLINTINATNYTFFDGWKYWTYRRNSFFK